MNIVTGGTQNATVGTKHQLRSEAALGTYSLLVDTTNMVNGDAVEFYIDVLYKSGGTARQTYTISYANAQSDPGKISVPALAPYGAVFSLKQTAGTSRAFDWCVISM